MAQVVALFGWDASGVTAGATVALGFLAAVSIVANWRLIRTAVRQSAATEQAARAAKAGIAMQEQQLALARDELLLFQRQVAVMERTAALQETDEARRAGEAFPLLELDTQQLSATEITGKVRYVHGTVPADAVEVRIWYDGRQYLARVGQVVANPTGTEFRAVPADATQLDTDSARLPGWVMTRGHRVDAVSWVGSRTTGRWWAQRFSEQNLRLGLPDSGEWDLPGATRIGILG